MQGQFPPSILLVGAGQMGGALLAAWLRAGLMPQSVTLLEHDAARAASLAGSTGAHAAASLEQVTFTPDCVVLAVKPQAMDETLKQIGGRFAAAPLYVTVAAGKTLDYYAGALGSDAAMVRAMPNTPATVGKGISGLIANGNVSEMQKRYASALLGAAGETIWLDDESLLDSVTAISGSGPAYVFLFSEALIEAGIAHGLTQEQSRLLALHTFAGSAALALASPDSLAQLRRNVTSPGGTTEAALKTLMHNDALKQLVQRAVNAAITRAREL